MDDDPSMFYTESDPASIVLQTLPAAPATVVLTAVAGDSLALPLDYTPGVGIQTYEYIFTDVSGTSRELQAGSGFPGVLVLSDLSVAHTGRYELRLVGECNSVLIVWDVTVEDADGAQDPTSISDFVSLVELSVLPNPASDDFSITFSSAGVSGSYSLELLDLSGGAVWRQFGALSVHNMVSLNARQLGLSAGTYFLSLTIGDKTARQAVVIAE